MSDRREISFENRRLAREASAELREQFFGADWTAADERALAEWYQQLDEEYADASD